MLQVYIAQNPTEAHFVKGLLETHNIECCVKGEILFSARGEIPITTETAPSVWINDEAKFEKAKAVIKEYEKAINQEPPIGENWVCNSCGEEHESQFTNCWKCAKLK